MHILREKHHKEADKAFWVHNYNKLVVRLFLIWNFYWINADDGDIWKPKSCQKNPYNCINEAYDAKKVSPTSHTCPHFSVSQAVNAGGRVQD